MDNNEWKAAKAEWEAADAAFKASPVYLAHQQAAAKWQAAWPARAKWRAENLTESGKPLAVARAAIPNQVSRVVSTPPGVVPEVPDPERVRQLINKVKGK